MKQLVLAFVVAACGGASPQPAPVTAAAPAPMLELGEVTLFEGDDAVFKLHADGSTEMGVRSGALKLEPGKSASTDSLPLSYRPGPRVTADGAFMHRGKVVARMQGDGGFIAVETTERIPGLTVSANAITLEHAGRVVTFALAADGTFTQNGGNRVIKRPMRITGANTPAKRRAILAVVGLTLVPGRKANHPPATSESATE